MTLPEVERLFRHWADYPPVNDLVHALAIWAGAVKPPAPSTPAKPATMNLAAMKQLFGEL